jgi:hypothetical protein
MLAQQFASMNPGGHPTTSSKDPKKVKGMESIYL